MIDLARVAMRKSVTVSDLKKRAEEIHREVGREGKVYTLRGVAHRIVYRVDEERQLVTIAALGLHDEAYRRARDR